uniref:F-box associated beta-propeller type 3 domain-containing protein n=1 Tax=Fagus sylvatica TaxID=28930 RepID=A0A2N9GDQ9_FAGSY
MLSTDSWRTVGPLSGSIVEIEDDFVFVNGALYYLARNTEGRKFILSFDVNDERFQEIMLPDDYLGEFSPHFCNFEQLAVFKGLLALVAFGTDLDEEDLCIIWVMREYGVIESWTLDTVPVDYVEMFYGFTDNGELLIEVKSGIVSFDPDSLNENNLGIQYTIWLGYINDFMESLVLVDE